MSSFQLLYTRNAIEDVKEAVGWYNRKQTGLGKRFRSDVLSVIEKIKNNPFFASVSYDNIRTASFGSLHNR